MTKHDNNDNPHHQGDKYRISMQDIERIEEGKLKVAAMPNRSETFFMTLPGDILVVFEDWTFACCIVQGWMPKNDTTEYDDLYHVRFRPLP